jgi:hypothetical protein
MDWIMMDWEGISHLFISWWSKRGEAGQVSDRGEKGY